MKINLKFYWTFFAALLFLGGFNVGEAKAQVLKEILKQMQTHQKSLVSLRSKITMEKYNAQLAESDIYNGTANLLRVGKTQTYVRIDWTKPVESLTLVDGQFILYRPRLKQAFVGKIDRIKENYKYVDALSMINAPLNEIKSNYLIKFLGQKTVKSGIETWHLEFIPKKMTNYKTAELWIDGYGMPIQAKVSQSNNDSTTIMLSDWRKNATMKAAVFQLEPPKGTKLITVPAGNTRSNTTNSDKKNTVKKMGNRKQVRKVTVRRKKRVLKRIKKLL